LKLQENLAYDAHGRQFLVDDDTVEVGGSLSNELHQRRGIIA
jgi:hypothetical protein